MFTMNKIYIYLYCYYYFIINIMDTYTIDQQHLQL